MPLKNVVGLFDTMGDAEAVVRDLRNAGVAEADISFAGRNQDAATMQSNEYVAEGHSEAAEGAGFGATGGTVVGGLTGLLVGLGALAIPGVGPVIAAGSLATALGSAALGAGIGAATGGLLGALVGAGIPEEDANFYAEGIRRGGALVMARVDDNMVDTALDIMERHNVVDIDERGNQFRAGGWSRFDENAEPYDSGDADRTPDGDDYDRSSKVGTAGGAVAGAATGAAMGSVGGPVGTVVGGAAGAIVGGGVGAAGDAAGVEATDDDAGRRNDFSEQRDDYSTTAASGTAYGSVTDAGYGGSSDATLTGTDAATYQGTTDPNYARTGDSYETRELGTTGDADRTPDGDDYAQSSKVGTAGGAVAGAATGAAMGSVGGPVGTVVGGAAGAIVGGGVGAAGDAAGVEATDDDAGERTSYDASAGQSGTDYGSARTVGDTNDEGAIENSASRITNATERGLDADLDRDGDVGQRDPRNNY